MIIKIKKYEASWCHQCKAMDRNLSQVHGIEVEHIDAGEMKQEELDELGIRGLPVCLLVNENNEVVDRINGVMPANAIINKIKQHQ